MRSSLPRPFLLALTLLLTAGAIFFVESRFGATEPEGGSPEPVAQTVQPERTEAPEVTQEDNVTAQTENRDRPEERTDADAAEESAIEESAAEESEVDREAERIAEKEAEYERAAEIVAPSGFVNTDADGVTIEENLGDGVVLVDFWAYSCYNCQNTQPYLNAWHEEYADDGLTIIGVHKPEFEFEKDYAGVVEAVSLAGIRYPVVLDNDDATWDAYDQRFWPTMYLIDSDGFVRYKHIGEGAYEDTEAKIRELLAERDRVRG